VVSTEAYSMGTPTANVAGTGWPSLRSARVPINRFFTAGLGSGVAVGVGAGVSVGTGVAVGGTGVEVGGSVGTAVGAGVGVLHPASKAMITTSIRQQRETVLILLLIKNDSPARMPTQR
jgi:hypothetical protein